jgi:hypothetical protein
MTDHDGSERFGADGEDGNPCRVEITIPRARSIVWLGLKVYGTFRHSPRRAIFGRSWGNNRQPSALGLNFYAAN